VSADDSFVVSSGAGAIGSIYDRDKTTQWKSSGANDDTTTVTIDVTFFEGTIATSRTITRILVLNHNLKLFNLYYWDGAAWQLIQAYTAVAAAYTVCTFAAQTTAKIRLEMVTTQTPNQEKAVGSLIATDLWMNIGYDFDTYDLQFREKVKVITLGDGSIRKFNIRGNGNRVQKYEAHAAWSFLPVATMDALKAIKESNTPFLWYPESVTSPDEIYYCHWVSVWKAKYTGGWKGANWNLDIDFKEV
jgi:hypothetical protein